jgi:hypothetical protein
MAALDRVGDGNRTALLLVCQGLLTLQRKRTGGNQQVTVKHIHQQVNVTQGGQAVVAGDKVTSRTRGRRRSGGGGDGQR